MSDFDLDGLFIEPRPDEDGWEAFLDLALERIGGERSPGLTNREIGELEAIIGYQVPFELGLLLVMGVPVAEPWRLWDDPEPQFAAWNEHLIAGICSDIEHHGFWFAPWGAKPGALSQQIDRAREQFASTVPPLIPIYGHRAMPLVVADGQDSSDFNPVFSVDQTNVTVVGDDLAAWMHKEFEVPLPMWQAEERSFPFWSELVN